MRNETDILSATAAHLWPELDPTEFDIVMLKRCVVLTTGKRAEARVLAQARLGKLGTPLNDLMLLLASQPQFGPGGNPSFRWYSEFRPGTDDIAKSKASETQDEPPPYSSIQGSGEVRQGGGPPAQDSPS